MFQCHVFKVTTSPLEVCLSPRALHQNVCRPCICAPLFCPPQNDHDFRLTKSSHSITHGVLPALSLLDTPKPTRYYTMFFRNCPKREIGFSHVLCAQLGTQTVHAALHVVSLFGESNGL
jgi:hypothetical protein